MAVGFQEPTHVPVPLDGAVVHDREATGPVEVRVGVLVADATVCGPARVTDGQRNVGGAGEFQLVRVADALAHINGVAFLPRHARGIVAPVGQATQAMVHDARRVLEPKDAHDAAHG